ncbi:MAG: hypothetical protein IKI68_04275 [Clostridia bacterium]|nr:hypothetical protein [Clostridia bacterium]
MKIIKKTVVLLTIAALTVLLCSCETNNSVKKAEYDSPEEFAKAFILASNKPDAEAVDNYTFAGGERFYKAATKAEKMSEEAYYRSISEEKASDYASYMEFQNAYRINSFMSMYGTKDIKINFKKVTAEKLDSSKLKKVFELAKEYDYIDKSKITDPYKVYVNFETTAGTDVSTDEVYMLVVKYDGVCKYVVSTDSEEKFDSGFDN